MNTNIIWTDNEPDTVEQAGDECVFLKNSGKNYDASCSRTTKSVCTKPAADSGDSGRT